MTKRQLIIHSLLLIIFATIVFVSIANYSSTKEYVQTSVKRETTELVSSFANESNRYSYERIVELELIADYLPTVLQDEKELVLYLNKQNKKMPFFAGLSFIRKDGSVLTADGYEFHVKQEESFKKALRGEVAFSETFNLHQDPNQKVTAISLPVYENNKIVGVLSGVVNMADVIGAMTEESRLPGSVFLLNKAEVVFSSAEKSIKDLVPDYMKMVDSTDANKIGSFEIDKNDAHFLAYAHTWNDFIILVDSSVNPDRAQLNEARWQNGFIIFITFAVVIAIALYVRHLENQKRNMMKRDLLTGLANGVQMEDDFHETIKEQETSPFAMYFVSIDSFNEWKERIGYQLSDQIIFAFSKKIRHVVGKSPLYRVGEEEFLIIHYADSRREHERFASRIINAMEYPVHMGGEAPIWLTVSIGICPSDIGKDMDTMLLKASYVNDEARKKGGNQIIYMDAELARVVEQNRLIHKELEHALEREEFYLVYQPIYEIASDSIVSFETLMRWKSPILGEVYPSDFIPLVEENNQIIPIGRWLIRKVALQINAWQKEGYENFTVTLNVSVKQLEDPEFINDVRKILRETKVATSKLIFEMTESVIAQNIDDSANVLSTLNSLGIKTALDDFGTGYSSLSILRMLPFQYIKIDRAFVWEMESDGGMSKSILKGVLKIANDLQLETIVEGVETDSQLEQVKQMGAKRIQGYYISKPVDPVSAINRLGVFECY